MKASTVHLLRRDIGYILFCIFLFTCGLSTPVSGQENNPASVNGTDGTSNQERKTSFRVSVDEVRIDAVVLDRHGRQETDLTADDFEIYQNNKKQDIISCVYVNQDQDKAQEGKTSPYDSDPPGSNPMLKKNEIQRTIVFLIDDFSMNFQQFHFTRMGLKNFVEKQMQPGDLVTIFRTSSNPGAMQLASSNKQQLLHVIDNIRWGVVGCGIAGCGKGHFGAMDARYEDRDTGMEDFREEVFYKGTAQLYSAQVAAIDYSIRALRDMPGRKYLMLITSRIDYDISYSWRSEYDSLRENLVPLFNKLADQALRANIVIHTLDIKGLQTGVDLSSGNPLGLLQIGLDTSTDYPVDYILSDKTGGMTVKNTNFFLSGIGPVHETIKGYYLLTYIPPAGTFEPGSSNKYHGIKVKVKPWKFGREILTRDGFYGGTSFSPRDPDAPIITVRDAISSPFLYNDLNVRLESGYAGEPDGSYLLRSWMHLDGKDLVFKDEKDGRHSVSLEAAAVTTDMEGVIRDFRGGYYDFLIRNEDLPAVEARGIDFDLSLPVQHSGAYYIRTAVKDRASQKMGTSYQFIEVPDLKKKRLSLSSIFIINPQDRRDMNEYSKAGTGSNEKERVLDGVSGKNPALRRYSPGEYFSFIAIAYNAKSRKRQAPQLESQFVIFKDGDKYLEGKVLPVGTDGIDDLKSIPITGRVHFKEAMEEGLYVLQLRVTDKQAKKKHNLAVQSIDFEILGKTSDSENQISALR